MSNLSSPNSLLTPTTNVNAEKLEDDLPKARFWRIMELRQWEGFWLERRVLHQAVAFRSSFVARDDDVLLTSPMKTGSTWLKSISLCIMPQAQDPNSADILTTDSPHFHIPTVETMFNMTKPPKLDIYSASSARLLHTHLPYAVLPDSVKTSACKIVYIARNPKDTIVSMWHYLNAILGPIQDPFPLDNAVECLCSGIYLYGSFFDHVVEYWLESKKRPEKILFLRYEELKSDPRGKVAEIAEFLGRPIPDEVGVDEVLRRCNFDRLKNLEVSRSGTVGNLLHNSYYYRKGEVGDWKSYLTPEMEERIDQACRLKLEPYGLFLI